MQFQFQTAFEQIKTSDDYGLNARILMVVLNAYKKGKPLSNDDSTAINNFIFPEMERLIALIPKTKDYKVIDQIYDYEDKLLGLAMLLKDKKYTISNSNIMTIKTLIETVAKTQVLEAAIDGLFKDDEVFKTDKIEKKNVEHVLSVIKSFTDEYQRGKLYSGLLHHKEKLNKLSGEAKNRFTEYFVEELERYLNKRNSLTNDELNNLEIAADVCKYFINAKLINLLKEILQLKHNNIRYYAIETLLINKEKVEPEIIAQMAQDLIYADLTYGLLSRHNQTQLFPKEFANSEYLAKSDMVHWLTYPTELNKIPDEIEFLGKVAVKKADYYIFKYKTDSVNLEDELHNVWLIGWASDNGGTFSNFDKLSMFEQKNLEKTLKFIEKHIEKRMNQLSK